MEEIKFLFSGAIPNTEIYINKVVYAKDKTTVYWSDDTKTISKCSPNDVYSSETGLLICICKKIFGKSGFRQLTNDWLPEQMSLPFIPNIVTLHDVRLKHK